MMKDNDIGVLVFCRCMSMRMAMRFAQTSFPVFMSVVRVVHMRMLVLHHAVKMHYVAGIISRL